MSTENKKAKKAKRTKNENKNNKAIEVTKVAEVQKPEPHVQDKATAVAEVLDRANIFTGPILSQFKGRLPSNVSFLGFKDSSNRQLKVQCPEFVVRGQSDVMTYQASTPITKDNAPSKPACRYLVGVLNKKSQKVSLIEAPLLESQTRPTRLLHSEVYGASTNLKYKDAQNDLAQTFGTRKRKTAVASLERNAVNYSALSSSASTLQEIAANNATTFADSHEDGVSRELLPPHDTETGAVDSIYPLDQLVDPIVLKAFIVIGLKNSWPNLDPTVELANGRSIWVLEKINQTVSSTSPKSKQQLQLIVLLDTIIAMTFCKPGTTFKNPNFLNNKLLGRSGKVNMAAGAASYLCTNFLETTYEKASDHSQLVSVYKTTGSSVLKAQNYALIIMLHLSDFKLGVEVVSKTFNVDSMKARVLLKGVGCTISCATTVKPDGKKERLSYGVLKAPLTFQSQSRIRAR